MIQITKCKHGVDLTVRHCNLCNTADEIERLTTEVRDANHEKHMAVVKKLSEISLLKGGWLDAIKAIDWFEEQTAEPCEPYPQSERDEDRKWLEDSSASGSQCQHEGIIVGNVCVACNTLITDADTVLMRATADSRLTPEREHDVNILGFQFRVTAGAPDDCILFVHDGRFVGRIEFDLTADDPSPTG